jgi:hypothetical protein
MIGLPFRIISTIAIALFFSSKWVRRAVAAVAVSAIIVAMQHQDALQALAGPSGDHAPLFNALAALAGN